MENPFLLQEWVCSFLIKLRHLATIAVFVQACGIHRNSEPGLRPNRTKPLRLDDFGEIQYEQSYAEHECFSGY